jgi:hypothetical protein
LPAIHRRQAYLRNPSVGAARGAQGEADLRGEPRIFGAREQLLERAADLCDGRRMKLLRPPPAAAEAGLRAMKVVATVDGPLAPAARALLDGAQRHLLGTSLSLDELGAIAPEELAPAIEGAELREQFVKGLVLVSLADGVPSAKKGDAVGAFAKALGVSNLEVKTVERLAHKHMLLFRADFMRRSHIADMVKHQVADTGLWATVKAVLGMRGLVEEPELAARYRALGALPKETLGRQYVDYLERNGFSAPGEKGGFPEAGVYHDFTHVLSGYATDSPGEMEVAAFVAGYKKENPFYVLLFVMLTFGTGVNVTPIPQPHSEGILGEPGLAEKVWRALERGGKVRVDLSDGWNHWEYVDKPIDEVRRLLGVEP